MVVKWNQIIDVLIIAGHLMDTIGPLAHKQMGHLPGSEVRFEEIVVQRSEPDMHTSHLCFKSVLRMVFSVDTATSNICEYIYSRNIQHTFFK